MEPPRDTPRVTGPDEFASEHGDWLVRLAYLLTQDSHDAHDLAQESLLKVWSSWSKVARADDQRAYVARLVMNTHRSMHRRKVLPQVPLDADAPLPSHDRRLDEVEDADALWRAMQVLSDRQRAVLVLRYWSDLDDESIATALGCRRATVRSLAARAFQAMRTELGDQSTDGRADHPTGTTRDHLTKEQDR